MMQKTIKSLIALQLSLAFITLMVALTQSDFILFLITTVYAIVSFFMYQYMLKLTNEEQLKLNERSPTYIYTMINAHKQIINNLPYQMIIILCLGICIGFNTILPFSIVLTISTLFMLFNMSLAVTSITLYQRIKYVTK